LIPPMISTTAVNAPPNATPARSAPTAYASIVVPPVKRSALAPASTSPTTSIIAAPAALNAPVVSSVPPANAPVPPV
jgi:hypothetical protein